MLEEIVSRFSIDGNIESITPFGSGHIHASYKVSTKSDQPNYLLQKVNHEVFRNVEGLMSNIELVTSHLQKRFKKEGIDQETLKLVKSHSGSLFVDFEGGFWRIYEFKDHLKSLDLPESDDQVYEGAKCFGHFLKYVSDLDSDSLSVIIPDFNNLAFRLEQFRVASPARSRVEDCEQEIRFVEQTADTLLIFQKLQTKKAVPIRVTHNDTKFNNVLLDENNRGKCVIDLDTVMPGIVHFDFGDGIRTTANTAAEDEPDLHKVEIDKDRFQAFTEGYMDACGSDLTEIEKKFMALSGAYMAFIMGLRFLTDHLNGNIYYHVDFPLHNLQRARCQLALTNKIIAQQRDLARLF